CLNVRQCTLLPVHYLKVVPPCDHGHASTVLLRSPRPLGHLPSLHFLRLVCPTLLASSEHARRSRNQSREPGGPPRGDHRYVCDYGSPRPDRGRLDRGSRELPTRF